MASPAAVLQILVTANTAQANAALAKTDAMMRRSAATAQSRSAAMGAALAKTQSRSAAMGAAIAKGAKTGALAVTALGAVSIKAAADFESSFAEVRKTVDTNEKGFARLERGLRNLAKEIPVSVNELNELAGQAGALGVKSKDIVRFTKTASMLGTTTDLAAEEAANALARLANIMDSRGRKAFERMGSTLVDLGNKGASTEREISDMALRIAGAGKQIGLAEKDVLGLAAALANVGIPAEMGGTAISRVMLQMQDAIARGGSELQAFADIAGVSASRFADIFERDATRAIALFAGGLADVSKEGGSVLKTLESVELNERRVGDTLARIGNNTKNFADAQAVANKAWKENNALQAEADQRYKTTASQARILLNRLNDVAITVGQFLLPAVNKAITFLGEKLPREIAKVVDSLKDFWRESRIVREAFAFVGRVAERVWAGVTQATEGAVSVLRGAVKVISGLLTLNLGRAWEGVKEIFRGGVKAMIGILRTFTAPVRELVATIVGALRGPLTKVWNFIKKAWAEAADFVLGVITTLLDGIAKAADAASALPGPIGDVWDEIQTGAENASDSLNKTREGLRETAAVAGRAGEKIRKELGENLRKAGGTVTAITGGIRSDLDKNTKKGADAMGRHAERGSKKTTKELQKARDKGSDATRDLARKGGRSFFNLANAAGKGVENIGDNVNKALKALNVRKPVNFGIKAPSSAEVMALHRQQGGPVPLQKGAVVPGTAPGDRHTLSLNGVPIAKVESGELISVANRKATAALMDVNDRVPRFAMGGLVGLKPGIARLAKWANKRFGTTVSSGLRPGDNDSFHGRGEAVDLVPPSMSATRGIFAAFKNQLAELFYDPWGGWDNGQMIGAIGDHMDHIHAAIAGGGSAVATMAKLKKVLLSGPDGPLKDIGQSALDKVHKAARQFLSKQGGAGHGNIGAGALSEGQFLALARRAIAITSSSRAFGRFDPSTFSPSGLLTLAKAESSLIPSSINNWDSNAAAGNPSGGLMHLTQSNMRLYAEPSLGSNMFNPLASIAASINYQRGEYGHQVTHSPYKLGGIVAKLAGGGLLGTIADIKQKLKRNPRMSKKEEKELRERLRKIDKQLEKKGLSGERRKALKAESEQITKKLKSNLNPKEVEKLQERLKKLRHQLKLQREQKKLKRERRKMAKRIRGRGQMEPWATQIEKATSTANTLAEHLGDLQNVHGFTDLPDVPDDEALLGPNGQALLDAYNKAVNSELAELTTELQRAHELLVAQFAQRQTIIDSLGVAGKRLIGMTGQKKGAEKRLKRVNQRIKAIESMPSNQRKRHAKELRNLRNERGTLKARISALKGAMGDEGLRGFITDNTDALNTLQGAGRDMFPVSDPFKESMRFGGDILNTRATIDSIQDAIQGMKGEALSMPTRPGPQAMNIQGLLAFKEAIDLGAFKTEPFMGAFAKGGVALVGEQGPELAHLPSGTRIHTAQETRDMMRPQVNITFAEGMEWLRQFMRVEINGELDERDRDTANYAAAGRL